MDVKDGVEHSQTSIEDHTSGGEDDWRRLGCIESSHLEGRVRCLDVEIERIEGIEGIEGIQGIEGIETRVRDLLRGSNWYCRGDEIGDGVETWICRARSFPN